MPGSVQAGARTRAPSPCHRQTLRRRSGETKRTGRGEMAPATTPYLTGARGYHPHSGRSPACTGDVLMASLREFKRLNTVPRRCPLEAVIAVGGEESASCGTRAPASRCRTTAASIPAPCVAGCGLERGVRWSPAHIRRRRPSSKESASRRYFEVSPRCRFLTGWTALADVADGEADTPFQAADGDHRVGIEAAVGPHREVGALALAVAHSSPPTAFTAGSGQRPRAVLRRRPSRRRAISIAVPPTIQHAGDTRTGQVRRGGWAHLLGQSVGLADRRINGRW